MNARAPFGLMALMLLLAFAAGVILLAEGLSRRQPAHTQEFQGLVGGLGFGAAVDLKQCAYGFDPRLRCGCSWDLGPIPGARCLCPSHAASVFYYPPLVQRP